MLIDKEVDIKVNPSNLKYLKEKGYDNLKVGKIIKIKIVDLSKGSHVKVEVKCNNCGTIKKIKYNSLIKNNSIDYYLCSVCKRKKNNKEKYGVENIFQLDEVKEKSKKTIQKKYGVDNISQAEEVKNKKIQTNNKKYNVDWGLSNKFIQEKSKNTLLEKYNVDNISKLEDVKNKKIQTSLKNYGVKHYSQLDFRNDKIREKYIEYIIGKYNVQLVKIDKINYTIKCNTCKNEYEINKKSFYARYNYDIPLCTKCNPINIKDSYIENEIANFIEKNCNRTTIRNHRKLIYPYEIDLYIPDLNLAFEINGLYWHSEVYKDNDYHLKKTNKCLDKNIQLIHLYEDDWVHRKEIVKSRILNLLDKTPEKIYARKCQIKEVDNTKTIKQFLSQNHLQGYVSSKYNFGLYYNNELVSLMTFGNLRKNMGYKNVKGKYELLRFCNKRYTTVIGGANRLFKYFLENYKPDQVISYSDRSWGEGNLYYQLGFEFIENTKPNYHYIVNRVRKNRFSYRKDLLVKEGYDENKSEHDIMIERGIYRIYNSGNSKFIWYNEKSTH